MRKRLIEPQAAVGTAEALPWLEVAQLASVEFTSEAPGFPVESALATGEEGPGWRAAAPGPQRIRLIFDAPREIRCIHLEFEECEQQRTQEFTLRWSGAGEPAGRELLRQQFNFSPAGCSRETEEYTVALEGVTALELEIIPDISRGDATASLRRWLLR